MEIVNKETYGKTQKFDIETGKTFREFQDNARQWVVQNRPELKEVSVSGNGVNFVSGDDSLCQLGEIRIIFHATAYANSHLDDGNRPVNGRIEITEITIEGVEYVPSPMIDSGVDFGPFSGGLFGDD